ERHLYCRAEQAKHEGQDIYPVSGQPVPVQSPSPAVLAAQVHSQRIYRTGDLFQQPKALR
ncbi:hypothetical protein BgiMline_031874, partial [Biomphalaria glabrata]